MKSLTDEDTIRAIARGDEQALAARR